MSFSAGEIRRAASLIGPKVAVLTGAGISVAAGIPDFRSPGGMYDTLRPELITCSPEVRRLLEADPTFVVSWEVFRQTPLPYLEVRRPFILGTAEQRWKPTLGHLLIALLAKKDRLKYLFTQNIDGLDYHINIPTEFILPIHGTIARASCEFCGTEMPNAEFRELVRKNIKDIYKQDAEAPAESTVFNCPSCEKPGLKPSTVLYGRNLPPVFFEAVTDLDDVDTLIVMGTSLTVSPANSVPARVPATCKRILINRDPIHQHVRGYNEAGGTDISLLTDCDTACGQLLKELGWVQEALEYTSNLRVLTLRASLPGFKGRPAGPRLISNFHTS